MKHGNIARCFQFLLLSLLLMRNLFETYNLLSPKKYCKTKVIVNKKNADIIIARDMMDDVGKYPKITTLTIADPILINDIILDALALSAIVLEAK